MTLSLKDTNNKLSYLSKETNINFKDLSIFKDISDKWIFIISKDLESLAGFF
jgi:hypothetical protein